MSAAEIRRASSEPDPSPARRYGAFLSYSHRDAALVAKLQRGLETYRLPPRLAGRETAVGPVPRSVGPIFRDRDELPAGADLATHVREGLAASRWLIVVCSPAAAVSPWVEREIIEFKRLHGEERVLAVIASGEPYASLKPGREAEECFPLALRRALADDGTPTGAALEPIAVDLRKQGDGPRMALLKLIAGMTGVGVDELAQRDAQRRARRLAWLAVGASAGMVVMGVLAFTATQARNEARQQRAQAEDLIEFMLGDLRRRLEPVGRLEVLDAVGVKALGYYAGQDTASLDATSLGHRSRAMHLIGEIRDLRGQRELSEEAFIQAADTTAQLLARTPKDPQRIFDHSQSEFWVGLTAWRRGNLPVAAQRFGNYLALAKQLVAIDPSNDDWQIELGFASMNLGIVFDRQGRLNEALEHYEVTRRIFEARLERNPVLFIELATAYGWLSNTYEKQDRYVDAAEAQHAKLRLFERMPNSAKDRRALLGRLNANYLLARLELQQGHIDKAEAAGREATALGRELVAIDPSNQLWLSEHAFAHASLASVLQAKGQCAAARETLDIVSEALPRLAAADPTNIEYVIALPGRWLSLAVACEARPDKQLIADTRGFIQHARALLDAPGNFESARARWVADMHYQLGLLLQRQGDLDAARAQWRDALALLEKGEPRPATAYPLLSRLRVHLALGQVDAARSYAERLRATPLRAPAALALLADPVLAPANASPVAKRSSQ